MSNVEPLGNWKRPTISLVRIEAVMVACIGSPQSPKTLNPAPQKAG